MRVVPLKGVSINVSLQAASAGVPGHPSDEAWEWYWSSRSGEEVSMEDECPTIASLVPRLRRYLAIHSTGGSLHIYTDDNNVELKDIEFCANYAASQGDVEGEWLARQIVRLSRTQRIQLLRRLP